MKPKNLLLLAALLAVFSSPALTAGHSASDSQKTTASGYTGPNAAGAVTSAADALQAADDTPVVLTGYITRRVGDEHYEFA